MQDIESLAARDFKKAVTAAKNSRKMFWRSQAPENGTVPQKGQSCDHSGRMNNNRVIINNL